jgi:hypothetical protein
MGKIILATFTVIIACMLQILIVPTVAQYACGLQSGEYAKYSWSITVSAASVSYSISGTLDVNIQSVSGSSYSANATWAVTGGSLPSQYDLFLVPQSTQSISGDVESGSGSTSFVNLLAIPANVSVGQDVPGVGNVTRTGSWDGRNAIIANSSMLGLGQGDIYYDRATGIVMYQENTLSYLGLYSYDVKLQMTDTNIWGWSNGSPWAWAITVIVIIIVLAAASAVLIRRRKLRPPARPTSTTQTPPPPPPSPPPPT